MKSRRTGFPNSLDDGEWYDVMRRQGGTQGCDGPVCSARQGEASSPAPWQLHGAEPGEFVKVYEESRLPTTV